jgi:hypothetical protein
MMAKTLGRGRWLSNARALQLGDKAESCCKGCEATAVACKADSSNRIADNCRTKMDDTEVVPPIKGHIGIDNAS